MSGLLVSVSPGFFRIYRFLNRSAIGNLGLEQVFSSALVTTSFYDGKVVGKTGNIAGANLERL